MSALLALGACRPASDPGLDLPVWEVGSVPLASLGALEGDPAHVFSRIADVRILAEGRVAVADGASGSIRIFERDGSFVRWMGGEGEGPGEFEYLSSIPIVREDTFTAYDSGLLRLTTFLPSGRVESTLTFRAGDGFPEVYLGPLSDGGHAVAWIVQQERDRTAVSADIMRIGRFDASGRFERMIGSDVGMRRLGSPTAFSPHFLAGTIGDTVVHTDGLTGAVSMTDADGVPVRTIEVPFERWDPVAAWSRLEPEVDSTTAARFSYRKAVGGADSVPVVSELLVEEDRLWLKRYDPGTDSHWVNRRRTGGEWLVVASDGRPIARVAIPVGLRLMDVRDDRLAGVSRDELDVERVEVYPLHRDRGAAR